MSNCLWRGDVFQSGRKTNTILELKTPLTEIHILENIKDYFQNLPDNFVFVIDTKLQKNFSGIFSKVIVIEGGEKAKCQKNVDFLVERLTHFQIDKGGTLVAIGGGTITDLVGFTASIYMRGINLVLVPTTLMAMVDAAIGGKNGIDLACGKNLLGTIYHPKAVLVCLNFLNTLDNEELENGFFEILKIGLCFDQSIWHLVQKNDSSMIIKAIEAKLKVVEKDPKDQSLRRILNFGHTIGHALEVVSNFEMKHGKAIGIGCVVESFLSFHLGYLEKKDFEEIKKVFSQYSLKLPKEYSRKKLLAALKFDKKNNAGSIRFVLIGKIGEALVFENNYCRSVSSSDLNVSLDWMESFFGN